MNAKNNAKQVEYKDNANDSTRRHDLTLWYQYFVRVQTRVMARLSDLTNFWYLLQIVWPIPLFQNLTVVTSDYRPFVGICQLWVRKVEYTGTRLYDIAFWFIIFIYSCTCHLSCLALYFVWPMLGTEDLAILHLFLAVWGY